jgi:hypothetical protein
VRVSAAAAAAPQAWVPRRPTLWQPCYLRPSPHYKQRRASPRPLKTTDCCLFVSSLCCPVLKPSGCVPKLVCPAGHRAHVPRRQPLPLRHPRGRRRTDGESSLPAFLPSPTHTHTQPEALCAVLSPADQPPSATNRPAPAILTRAHDTITQQASCHTLGPNPSNNLELATQPPSPPPGGVHAAG